MIKVQRAIPVYELDGKEIPSGKELLVGIDSHRDRAGFITLIIGEHRYTVIGSDLRAAVENAQNINRWVT